ncbi:MAG: hypothetical protein L0220_20720, partial [Acidobacteria bacterium]|nr:hypothetical protein [Acidobacteriota bacterium]
MLLQVKSVADLFDKPNKPGNQAKFITTINEEDNTLLEKVDQDGDWIEVRSMPRTLFVKASDVVEATEFKFQPVNLSSFVYFSTAASETFNQNMKDPSGGISRDYILGLALVLNGLEEKGLTEDVLQEFDPFHFTEAEWKEFCESSGNTSDYQDFDRFDPLAQIDGAVFVTSQLTSKLVHSLTDPGDEVNPRIPNS